MDEDDLGPMPEPHIEPGESSPGGVDAVGEEQEVLQIPDLPNELNPDFTGDRPTTRRHP